MNRFIDDVWLERALAKSEGVETLLSFIPFTANRSSVESMKGAEVILQIEIPCRYRVVSIPSCAELGESDDDNDDDDDVWEQNNDQSQSVDASLHSGYPFFTLNVLLWASHDGRPGSLVILIIVLFFLLLHGHVTSLTSGRRRWRRKFEPSWKFIHFALSKVSVCY